MAQDFVDCWEDVVMPICFICGCKIKVLPHNCDNVISFKAIKNDKFDPYTIHAMSEYEAIKQAKDATILSKTGYVNFDSLMDSVEINCCEGWDGISERCACGKYKVFWHVLHTQGRYLPYPIVNYEK
jgi:hypothetical protein